ncbi:MAG: 3-dehydroquinate synthase [Pseudomonadota bacterium]|nr:3-dehydroquinate synthase [Pseudomonadota bacterium]MEC7560015.1 3-dehydroquinate synthase [Pseudomonadota bacterium]MEC7662473.1 3-dehydroquinate synthase [Pseudomonadota bacterium]MEC7779947.1 3-dehydroquinate synthase [Pseudomonadota bacterium]MEC7969567.1 3-dehydroquinate synthase [Pseudomonadota bacterium]
MQQLVVEIPHRQYPIFVAEGLLADTQKLRELLLARIQGRQVAIITNKVVAPLYLDALLEALDGLQVDVMQMDDGEAEKNLQVYQQTMDFLLAARHNRSTCLIALGGGVVGDLCGFVAATFQRGVDFVQIPTTLLAQVDSSVGGKTAVNHPQGKNMIGAFHQPLAVLADTATLGTLPSREYAAGLAEVVKYGVIEDAAFFEFLEQHSDDLLAKDGAVLSQVILRCCAIKAEVVSADERESGRRAILNYGHTFGHGIEKLCGYGQWLHGEAVAIGMVMAARLSVAVAGLDESVVMRLTALLRRLGLPTALDQASRKVATIEAMMDVMGLDKKVVDGRLRFIVASQLGQVQVRDDIDAAVVRNVLAQC